ncbi:hypothetical protein GOV07_00270 [Candidatus Woesearchaeota archaeon]|nr:hypothetical protein [Candidatus Woesearchaeota archaeon]
MGIERIILGDDNLDFAWKAMPEMPGVSIEYVDRPEQLLDEVRLAEQVGRPYDIIISDYDYGEGRMNGLEIFTALDQRGLGQDARRILWTGNANEWPVQEGAKALGLELLDKGELGSLVGMTVSKAPLKRDGDVLIYVKNSDDCYARAMRQMVELMIDPARIEISSNLKPQLATERYGLVIDTSTLGQQQDALGVVTHDMKYVELSEVPTVTCLRRQGRELIDIATAITGFYGRNE